MEGEPVPADAEMTITFRDAEELGGSSGCNSFGGSYRTAGDEFRVTSLGGTAMGCPRAILDREEAFMELLPEIRAWAIAGNLLELRDEDGQVRLVYVREA
jgi:heat shock protein HslJ